jgi:hypothetical protein
MKLIIPKAIEEKIHAYVRSVDSEIAGMGKVRVKGEDTIIVEDVMIYEQTVSGATADLSPQAIAKWQSALVKAGGSPKHWRLWWHSHDTMSAFFSTRDTDTIDGSTEADWLVSLVVNKKRERQARVDLYRPFRMFIEADIEIEGEPITDIPADIALEVAQKVKKNTPSDYIGYGKNWDKEYGKTPYTGKRHNLANPYSLDDETDYSVPEEYNIAETESIIKMLEAQIADLEGKGRGTTNECIELTEELADWYYALADLQSDTDIAESMRGEAQLLESVVNENQALPL